jgi:hypothetical protein
MTGDIHRKTVYHLLHREVLELAKVLRIVFLIGSDDAAGARSINTLCRRTLEVAGTTIARGMKFPGIKAAALAGL